MSSTLLPISSTGGFTTTGAMIANAYSLPDGQPATLEPYLIINEATGNLDASTTIQLIGNTQGFFASATSEGNYNLWFNSAVRDAAGNTYVVGGNGDNGNGSIWSFTSSGAIRWKTAVDDIVSGENVRVECVRLDTANDRLVVSLEWYDGTSYQDGWLALDPADGTYMTSVLLSTPPNANPYVNDMAIDNSGEVILVGGIEGEYSTTTGIVAQPGSTTSILWINNSDLPIQVDPGNSPQFEIDIQPSGPAEWVSAFNVNQIPELACETLTGTGTGARLQVRWTGTTNTYDYVYANQSGIGYALNDRLRVRGSLLNGVDNTDITATATSSSDVGSNTVAVFDKATYPSLGQVTSTWHAFFPSGLAYNIIGSAVDTGTTWEITVEGNGVDFSGSVMFTGAGNDCFVYISYEYAGTIYLTPLWPGTAVQQVKLQIGDTIDFSTGGPWSVRYALDGQASIWTPNWQHTYGGQDWQHFNSVAVDPTTGDIYTYGRFYINNGGVSRSSNLMKLNSSGVTQWSKYVEDGNSTSGAAGTVLVDGDGNIILVGENGGDYTMVTKLDSDGTLIWQSIQDNDAQWDNEPRGALDEDGNIYISGIWAANDNIVSIMKLNGTDGTLAWARFVENDESYGFSEFHDGGTQPMSVADGKFIYTCYVPDTNGNSDDGFLMEMPTDGTLTGTYGRWIYSEDTDAEFIDNTSNALVETNSNGVPIDLVTQTVTGSSATVLANDVGADTIYPVNTVGSSGGGIMFADGSIQTTAAGGSSSPNNITNGTSSATIADADGNLVINLNDGGALWTFTTSRDILGRVDDNITLVALDDGDDPQVRQEVRDLNDNNLARTSLDNSNFEIELNIGGTYGSWEFTNEQLSMPSSTDAFIRGYDSNVTIYAMNTGGGRGIASIQSVSAYNEPNIFSQFTAATTGANITVYNGGSFSGTGHIWQFGNDGNLTLPANTFSVNYANGSQVQLGGGGTALPTNAPGYLRNDGVGALSWNTATVTAGSPAYTDVWSLADKLDSFWTEYTLAGTVPMMYDYQGTSNITLTGSALYGKQMASGDKVLVINNAPIHTDSTYAMVVEFPATPAAGDTFQIPFVSASQTITAGSFAVGMTYTITQPGSTNFIAIGAADNNAGTVFVATGLGSGSGTATETPGVIRTIFLPASGQRAFTLAQGQTGRIEFGQGTFNIGVYYSVAGEMGGQPITWVYAGPVGGTPTWFQTYF